MLLGFLSGQLAGSAADNPWFEELRKPSIYPPAATFGIVWTVLYFLMGVSFAAICSAWGSRYRIAAIIAFVAQFCLNLMWSPIFFMWHQISMALAVIVLLDVALVVTIFLFLKVRRWAGLLLVPYLLWALFATLLNLQILQLNPDASGSDPNNAVERIEL